LQDPFQRMMNDYFAASSVFTNSTDSPASKLCHASLPDESDSVSTIDDRGLNSANITPIPFDVPPKEDPERICEASPSFLPDVPFTLDHLLQGRPVCQICLSSKNVRKREDYFLSHGELREYWSCDGCGHRVPPNVTGRRLAAQLVGDILSRFYGSQTILEIENGLLEYRKQVNVSTILDYVEAYPYLVSRFLCWVCQKYGLPNIGSIWQVDEKPVTVAGMQFWIMAVVDVTTQFVLVLRVFKGRTVENLANALREARLLAKKSPLIVETDALTAYPKAIRRALGDVTHWRVKKSEWYGVNNLVEHFNSKLEAWLRRKKRLHELNTAQHLMDGVWIHHNFGRPSTSQFLLKQRPSEVAGFPIRFERPWTDSLITAERAAQLGHIRFSSPKWQEHIDQWVASPTAKHRGSRQKILRAKSKMETGEEQKPKSKL